MDRTHDVVGLGQLHGTFGSRNAEIKNLDGTIRSDDDVLRLDITMNNASGMSFRNCRA